MEHHFIKPEHYFWLLQGVCALHHKPYSPSLTQQQLPPPYTPRSFLSAMHAFGFNAALRKVSITRLHDEQFPLILWLMPRSASDIPPTGKHDSDPAAPAPCILPAMVLQADTDRALIVEAEDPAPRTVPLMSLAERYTGLLTRVTPKAAAGTDPDSEVQAQAACHFGFRWFAPELLKHKKLWQEILLASLIIQLIALATPLFTQTVIDKVVVHRTQSTLIAIAIGMAIFMLFSSALSWLRQYLVLHTGNRVDAVLGACVVERLFKLPPMYFQYRPTGVITTRLNGVETIREFIAGAAVTLILDLPFLLIFVVIMFYYSAMLTLIVMALLAAIAALSLLAAPVFQSRLQEQFQQGARNQAFLTEYVVGLETVKSLQLEPQIHSKYSHYLASYLQASFATKQLANSYNTAANLLEQLLSLLILAIGAYTVMHDSAFTIGMLVAFQMFAGKLSQPVLRLVGLWQQFQQARLSVDRLGDLMNAPTEPYSAVPARDTRRQGKIEIEQVGFRYAGHLPLVYENLSLTVHPGQSVAIMGPSGCGKSTLAKLMQGFYQPSAGQIKVDGIDIRNLPANELRSCFGVVPQETTLFSGTVYDNLQMANPHASFEQITAACKMAEIHGAIEALPQGYQTEIGERGAGLSGGQKQRIAIARALLKRPGILIFDEATSALDGPTAENFARTINALNGKVTILFITHALPKGLRTDAVYRLGPQGAQCVALAPMPAAPKGGKP